MIETEDVIDKIVYALANPVSSGLVDEGRKWPGLRRGPLDLLRAPRKTTKTGRFLSPRSRIRQPPEISVSKPPGFEDHSDSEFAESISTMVDNRERNIRLEAECAPRALPNLHRRMTD